MDAKETSLKPCPFCGSEPVMRRGGRYGFWALCQHCGAALRMSDTEEDAANAWNRRATEAEGNQATQEEPSSGANPDAETVADIRAWLANGEVERCLAAITDTDAMHDMLTAVADRIEAAAERERVKARRDAEIEWARIGYEERKAEEKREPGNAAAMREALMKIRDKCVIYNNDLAEEIDALCGNALAAPAGRDDAITATASPRPWSLFVHEEEVGGDGEISICAENEWIATMNLRRITAKADAALIVDAVNNVPMFDILKSDYKDLMGDVDRLKAERDRLREIVRRLVRVAINDRETLRHINSDTQYATDDDDAIGDALREARAAIGEGVANG